MPAARKRQVTEAGIKHRAAEAAHDRRTKDLATSDPATKALAAKALATEVPAAKR